MTTVEERSARSHSAKHTLQIADESQTFAVLSTEYTVGDKKKMVTLYHNPSRNRGEQLHGQVAMCRNIIQPSP